MRAVIFGVVAIAFTSVVGAESLPPLTFGHEVESSKMLETYRSAKYEPGRYAVRYSPSGKFFNMEVLKASYSSPTFKFDENGLPMVSYEKPDVTGRTYHYNPVTLSQFILREHARVINGERASIETIKKAADMLIELQSDDGAFRYDYSFRIWPMPEFQKGWVSALGQGNAISAYVRAWKATGDERYAQAAAKAFAFLKVKKADGGVRTNLSGLGSGLERYMWLEEYPAEVTPYTLNGLMFTLFGLYDWCKSSPYADKASACYYFDQNVKSLKKVLPLYSVNGASMYDLSIYTYGTNKAKFNAFYHMIHIMLLSGLYTITGDAEFASYAQIFDAAARE